MRWFFLTVFVAWNLFICQEEQFMWHLTGEKVQHSKAYQKASNKAQTYVADPEKLSDLLTKASQKAEHQKQGPLDQVWNDFTAIMRMLQAYTKGQYRKIPIQTLLLLTATIIYFVMPVDLIPDVIIGLGLLDDAALIGLTIQAFQAELHQFREWECQQLPTS
jgi:uncharacterized membrane protein YkvA (DUF1232 family)